MKKLILFLLLSIATYGQIPTTGQEQDFDYGIKNNVSPTDDNAPYFTVQNSDGVLGKSTSSVWAKKIYVDNTDAKKSFLSTGLIKNGLVELNNSTTFNVTAGIGVISNFDDPENPIVTLVSFPAFTAVTPTYLNTSNITYVAINSTPAIVMQASPFTDTQRRDLIILGAIVHSNLSTINTINNISAPSNADTNQLHDLMEAIGALNISGNKYSANGTNLSLNKSAGDIFKLGINFANNWKDPHKLTIDAQTLLTLRYRTQNGTEGADVTVLNPSVYDLNNVLTAVPSNRFSIQTVTLFQSGITRVQYGQNTYATMSEAEAAINTRAYVVESNIALNGIARAYIILKNSTTSLQNASDAKIVEAQKFGGSTSGGVALTNASIIAALGYTPENIANKSTTLTPSDTLYPTNNAVLATLPKTYTTTVYVNTTSPNTATIFDDENPPTINDDGLKANTDNLYIGSDASAWVYNGSTYVTKVVPATSNFYINSTSIDAGNSKDVDINRIGAISSSRYIATSSGLISRLGSSNTQNLGSYLRLANNSGTENNQFQLNASNGVDLWNYSSGVWNKRFTFSSDGYLTATNGQLIGGTGAVNYVPKFTGTGTLGNTQVSDDGNYVSVGKLYGSVLTGIKVRGSSDLNGVGQVTYVEPLTINGNIRFQGFGYLDFGGVYGVQNLPAHSVSGDITLSSGSYKFASGGAYITSSVGNPLSYYSFHGHEFKDRDGAIIAKIGKQQPDKSSYFLGNVSIGTSVNDGVNALQVNGSISATNYTGSATLTGTPTAPTAAPGTNTTQIATMEAVQAAKQGLQPLISYLESDNATKSIWNNGVGDVLTNTSFGYLAAYSNTTGSNNTSIGFRAGAHSGYVGGYINQLATKSVYIGGQTVAFGNNSANDNEIVIGFEAIGNGTNTATLGNSSITSTHLKGVIVYDTSYTVATLPTPTGKAFAFVTDATAPIYLGTLTGGGTVVCPVFYDGVSWKSH